MKQGEPDSNRSEAARAAGHISWILFLLGWLFAATIVASAGHDWAPAVATAYKAVLISTSLAFLCALVSLFYRVSDLGVMSTVLSLIGLVPLLRIFFGSGR